MSDDYKTLSSEIMYQSGVFTVKDDKISLPNGKTTKRFNIEHPGAAVILPRDAKGNLILVEQYRHSAGELILEFPAGTLEIDEDPLHCAKREIIEETGFAAENWTPLGAIYPAPGFCNELQHLYFADGLQADFAEPDEDEIIEVRKMTVPEVEAAIMNGAIKDGKSISIFCRARLRGLI